MEFNKKAQCLWSIGALLSRVGRHSKRDTWSVSGNSPVFFLSELSDRWCLLRWKSRGGKRWEHAGEQCHTPLELVSDGRHESV